MSVNHVDKAKDIVFDQSLEFRVHIERWRNNEKASAKIRHWEIRHIMPVLGYYPIDKIDQFAQWSYNRSQNRGILAGFYLFIQTMLFRKNAYAYNCVGWQMLTIVRT